MTCVSKEPSDQGTSSNNKSSDLSDLKMRDVQRLEKRRCPPMCEPIPSKGNLNIIRF